MRTWDPFPVRRGFAALLSALALCGISIAASLLLGWPLLPAILGCACAGLLVGWLSYPRSRRGVTHRLLRDHARWLVSEETVIVLQAPVQILHLAVSLLREGGDIPPAVFILHPERRPAGGDVASPLVQLLPEQFREHAERLAFDHRTEPGARVGAELRARLQNARREVHEVCIDLTQAARLEQGTPPTAEWILDNEYVLESNARDVLVNLSVQFCRQLPSLSAGRSAGLPRIYDLACELVADHELRVDRDNILAFTASYQSASPLTTGELWALPQMLRLALIASIRGLALRASTELREREIAAFWANRLIRANRRGADQLFAALAALAVALPAPGPYLAGELVDHLYDEEAVLVLVQAWLERAFHQSLHEIHQRDQNRQAKDQISVGNAFTSLRQLALLDWRQIFERLSRVEQLLRTDPAGTYPDMDFDTRDRYRKAVEELSRRSHRSEIEVTRELIELAAAQTPGPGFDERRRHVGTWLIGKARPELLARLGCRESRRARRLLWVRRHASALYLPAIAVLTVASTLGISLSVLDGQVLAAQLVMTALLLLPASQLVIELLNYLVTRFIPPRSLPKMDFKTTGVPDMFRTLVVVPLLLGDEESIRAEVEKLEVRFLANMERNLLFSLFTDFRDSDVVRRDDDARLLQTVVDGLEALNGRHGGGRFLLFHRARVWSDTERKFIGWERKRGKLEELNGLIAGSRPEESARLVHVGDPASLRDVRFVITLDSDTQLPPGAARRLIETLAHPLNSPRFDPAGRVEAGTFTIIQPRVSPSLPSASASPFSRLFADAVGIDPYTHAVSDVHQDLTGEGSYYGKGIYDVRAFDRVLTGRFPDERLLSHDLIEGAHVRVGLASDIELYDEFPQGYAGYAGRQHRWIRGDWQIARWVTGRIPRRDGGSERNPLSVFDRWKLLDNLRRSLVPAASVVALAACWFVAPRAGWIATAIVAGQLLFRPLAQPFTMMTSCKGLKGFSFSRIAHDVARALADAALLPHQAALAVDAIVRTAYRSLISHRRMLQWSSAQALPGVGTRGATVLLVPLCVISFASVAAALLLARGNPIGFANAAPWLAAWFLSPVAAGLLNLRPHAQEKPLPIPPADARFMREIARRTWRYFDDFVGADSSWLPPDNYQAFPRNELALRTSPTNIGFWMVSLLAARDFGYQTLDQVVERLTRTLETIQGLERFEGHLLNWYDLRTRAPLEPRYVSTVDSGNLLGSLVALTHGLEELIREPVLDGSVFSGLRDTGRILRRILGRDRSPSSSSRALASLLGAWGSAPDRFAHALRLLRRGDKAMASLTGEGDERTYWAAQLAAQTAAARQIADRYLAWIEILAEKSEVELSVLGREVVDAVRVDTRRAPSLVALAGGDVGSMRLLQKIADAAPDGPLSAWRDRVLQAFSTSRWLAGEILAQAHGLMDACRTLAEQIDMRFLYDADRRLFSIGHNVSEGRRDGAYYDLLASESRLGSFVAIARGDVPFEHWFSLSRPYSAVGRHRVLLSWTGTMFEYFMPLIFQRSLPHTLLDEASRGALAVQIAYGRQHHVPWGISESAFSDLDLNRIYQYRAFGVPALGLKREIEEKVVVSPYATMLAAVIAPREALRNLRHLAALGLLAGHGYYEAIDFSRQHGRIGERGVIVQAFMAHHQGMGFLSLANLLLDGAIRRRFHADGRVRAAEPLLHERVPGLPSVQHISTRERAPSADSIGEAPPSTSTFDTAHTRTPKTQLLSNGRYSVMLTNAGGGYSQWGADEITRFRSDGTRDPWGTFLYLAEPETGVIWSAAFQPCGAPAEPYSVSFALDRAAFRRVDNGIQTATEIVVSPEDDVEIRRITLSNRSLRTRRIECSSYVELSMAPHAADMQHPAFNKMFIQTESLPAVHALLASRRPRGEGAPRLYVAHRVTLETGVEEPLRFETDRRVFIGRGRTLANPRGSAEEPHNSEGYVLDPILSLRTTFRLSPGQRAVFSLVIAAGSSRDHVVNLMSKYADAHALNRAMDFAWAAAQLELRVLRIQPDDARRFQQLASALIYPNRLLRSAGERIAENVKGQAGLWPYGISGDLPIALVTIGEMRDVGLIGQMLQAHTYWRMHGLAVDLVILAEESSSYERPVHERLEALIQAHATQTGRDKPGGVYLRSADQMPEGDLTLLHAAASVVLVGARGPLSQQVGIPGESPDPASRPAWKRAPEDRSRPLPFLELPYFNGLGGFTPDGREYAIYLAARNPHPRPLGECAGQSGLRDARERNRRRLHLEREQPEKPSQRLVERSRHRPRLRGVVYPGRGNGRLLDSHGGTHSRGGGVPGAARGRLFGIRAQQQWHRAGAHGVRAHGWQGRFAGQGAEAAAEERLGENPNPVADVLRGMGARRKSRKRPDARCDRLGRRLPCPHCPKQVPPRARGPCRFHGSERSRGILVRGPHVVPRPQWRPGVSRGPARAFSFRAHGRGIRSLRRSAHDAHARARRDDGGGGISW